jgi:hypothetical protein
VALGIILNFFFAAISPPSRIEHISASGQYSKINRPASITIGEAL